ncbi:rod shape-determining protein RodA [candidate division CPR3 bacterium GWF2_35_18]|uniref:Rod shape-determining protein RodA n=1 Tax=candidate division CPR3 bacterium GW2011_GWF2_35_18 TaxID=1618350 RepID=A0A0G0BLF9_UNCC3|nr:MAG: Rod shape-determining protein RodA [candidate division CPR3 bacterium GW2011_GWF2_35_18]KKP86173.1 MAG: Rod shape-determining protein RodA [candidate division CPR3 bacterium GW2011_GWE2_35_7]OGB63474.1 MAG: rod shape-determining protein RodA [candidate division CPR3 bacterium GWF2_35_18]OGB64781.1 MAG: rod shape-determining protein RodA [candidate division CPR3 bacterium RIFOXYA2_FULL_35_13]OGB78336.1 MAG: rod shape-determining protein RodA [candidate division CPR3 bacterium RIFOXYB2_FU
MERKAIFSNFNWILFLSMTLLIVYGTMMILSTVISKDVSPLENKLFVGHLLNITIGMACFFIFSQLDYRFYFHLFIPILIIIIVLLALVPVLGYISHGAVRWIDLGFTSFQPSEITKILFILFLAAFLIKYRFRLPRVIYFLGSILLTGIVMGLVFIQPDLGTSIVSVIIWFGMYYFAGMSLGEFLIILLSSLLMLPGGWFLLKDYQKERILVFLNPQHDPLGSGYAILQSIIAIGSGQFMGLGWGRGTQSKLQFLPERQTDFIFATLSEEMGFVGIFILIALFVILLMSLLQIIKNSEDKYGKLVGVGVFCWFTFQILVNIGMNLGIMPITGIPLPFISYGGSSLLACMIALGIMQSVVKYGK